MPVTRSSETSVFQFFVARSARLPSTNKELVDGSSLRKGFIINSAMTFDPLGTSFKAANCSVLVILLRAVSYLTHYSRFVQCLKIDLE